MAHEASRGKVMTISAPPPLAGPTRDLAAVGFDDALGNRHAEAGSLGLGREERLENPLPLLRGQARAVVAHGHAHRRPAVDLRFGTADAMRTGSRQAAREFSRMLRKTCSSRNGSTAQCRSMPAGLFAQRGVPALAQQGQVLPRLPPDRRTVPDLAVELERGGVAADLFVELLEVVLGLLDAVDQVQGLGPVLHFPGEHLQARLAAGQGVAALVGQAGHHLADGRQPFGLQQFPRSSAVARPPLEPLRAQTPAGAVGGLPAPTALGAGQLSSGVRSRLEDVSRPPPQAACARARSPPATVGMDADRRIGCTPLPWRSASSCRRRRGGGSPNSSVRVLGSPAEPVVGRG